MEIRAHEHVGSLRIEVEIREGGMYSSIKKEGIR
jgi:hypothetical protein